MVVVTNHGLSIGSYLEAEGFFELEFAIFWGMLSAEFKSHLYYELLTVPVKIYSFPDPLSCQNFFDFFLFFLLIFMVILC